MKGVRMKTRIVELIITDDRRGSGLDGDPVRNEARSANSRPRVTL